ncbi:hypothetical protein V2J09_020992 [Rumex salicifolius]
MSLETFKENWSPQYQTTNSAGIPEPNGSVYWNFNSLVGLFFPAVTGIMAGSNRSASLKDTQRSIPVGTLAATLTTSGLYLVSVLIFGAFATREKLLTDRLITATVAWPFPAIIYMPLAGGLDGNSTTGVSQCLEHFYVSFSVTSIGLINKAAMIIKKWRFCELACSACSR